MYGSGLVKPKVDPNFWSPKGKIMSYGELKSVCIKSKQDGLMHCLGQADLIKTGIPNDVHCDGGDFQVSILPEEVIKEREKETGETYKYGDFGENLVISGVDYKSLKVGDSFSVGDSRLLITQIGANPKKRDGSTCKGGMHKSFIFCRVTVAGIITIGDQVYID